MRSHLRAMRIPHSKSCSCLLPRPENMAGMHFPAFWARRMDWLRAFIPRVFVSCSWGVFGVFALFLERPYTVRGARRHFFSLPVCELKKIRQPMRQQQQGHEGHEFRISRLRSYMSSVGLEMHDVEHLGMQQVRNRRPCPAPMARARMRPRSHGLARMRPLCHSGTSFGRWPGKTKKLALTDLWRDAWPRPQCVPYIGCSLICS